MVRWLAPGIIDAPRIVGGQAVLDAPADPDKTLPGFDHVDKGLAPAVGEPGSAAAIAAMDMAAGGVKRRLADIGDLGYDPAAVPGAGLRPGGAL